MVMRPLGYIKQTFYCGCIRELGYEKNPTSTKKQTKWIRPWNASITDHPEAPKERDKRTPKKVQGILKQTIQQPKRGDCQARKGKIIDPMGIIVLVIKRIVLAQ